MSTFGIKLKEIRKIKGYSQASLAKALNVSRSAVSMWEMGEREPELAIVAEVAALLDVDLEELVEVRHVVGDDLLELEAKLPGFYKHTSMPKRVEAVSTLAEVAGYGFEKFEGYDKYIMTVPDGAYPVIADDVEAVVRAAERAALLQMQLIEQREHQKMLEGLLRKEEDKCTGSAEDSQ